MSEEGLGNLIPSHESHFKGVRLLLIIVNEDCGCVEEIPNRGRVSISSLM